MSTTLDLPLLIDGVRVSSTNPIPDQLLPPHTAVPRTMTSTVTAGQMVTDTGPASSLTSGQYVLGMAAQSGTGTIWVVVRGDVSTGTALWQPGTDLFLGPNGFPTSDPASGVVNLAIGHVVSAGLVHLRLGLPIIHS